MLEMIILQQKRVNNSKYICDFYEVLPIDNVYLNEGVVIKDIYGDGEYFQKIYGRKFEGCIKYI